MCARPRVGIGSKLASITSVRSGLPYKIPGMVPPGPFSGESLPGLYINTLMLQQVMARPKWTDKLTPRDLRALTPLIWDHVNPYGRFELDMNARLPLE